MQRLHRRKLGHLTLAVAGALVGFRPPPAGAAALLGPRQSDSVPLRYVLPLDNNPTADNVWAHLAPSTDSDIVAYIPYGTPVGVLRQASGEQLDFGDGIWWEVRLPYGAGWVYSALLGDTPRGAPAPPLPPPVPEPPYAPDPVGPGRSIVVDRDAQFLWAYDGTKPVLSVGCSTGGASLPTPIGEFAVTGHFHPHLFLSLWKEGSPYYYAPTEATFALRFLGADFYLHDAPWRHVFGPDSQGGEGMPGDDTTGSHGCVNLPYPAARFLYNWAADGTPVRVVGLPDSSKLAALPPPMFPVTSPLPKPSLTSGPASVQS